MKERAESLAHFWVCGSESENLGWPALCPVFSSHSFSPHCSPGGQRSRVVESCCSAVPSQGANPGALTPRVSSCPVVRSHDHVHLPHCRPEYEVHPASSGDHHSDITSWVWVLKNQADWCPYLAFLWVVIAKKLSCLSLGHDSDKSQIPPRKHA